MGSLDIRGLLYRRRYRIRLAPFQRRSSIRVAGTTFGDGILETCSWYSQSEPLLILAIMRPPADFWVPRLADSTPPSPESWSLARRSFTVRDDSSKFSHDSRHECEVDLATSAVRVAHLSADDSRQRILRHGWNTIQLCFSDSACVGLPLASSLAQPLKHLFQQPRMGGVPPTFGASRRSRPLPLRPRLAKPHPRHPSPSIRHPIARNFLLVQVWRATPWQLPHAPNSSNASRNPPLRHRLPALHARRFHAADTSVDDSKLTSASPEGRAGGPATSETRPARADTRRTRRGATVAGSTRGRARRFWQTWLARAGPVRQPVAPSGLLAGSGQDARRGRQPPPCVKVSKSSTSVCDSVVGGVERDDSGRSWCGS